ncbi:peptidylprolyl isomerase [Uliginosibacterium gangwonense]|uniref:peptidylprolyl isomerase n=1 Tax=Uliginosibacterium gangwonense TaxID=392736 RepID=UPI000477BB52|nr:peptidylprolyl isomerase [Uliginosibacterium gangwonense]
MKKTLSLAAAALLMAVTQGASAAAQSAPAASASAPAAAANGTVAKVNGAVIPAAMADVLIKEQTAQGAPANDQLRAQVRQHLIQREVLLQEARKSGTDKDPAVRLHMAYAADNQLVGAYLQAWSKKHPVTDVQLKAEYDKQVKQMGDTEYSVRHILVDKEEDAKALITKLQGGAKFADLAKASSKDPGSKENGGDLGWARPATYVPEFAKAVSSLAKGKYTTTPVKTQYGYHVILLENTRKANNPKFEQVKPQMQQQMQQQAMQKYIDELVSKAKVE